MRMEEQNMSGGEKEQKTRGAMTEKKTKSLGIRAKKEHLFHKPSTLRRTDTNNKRSNRIPDAVLL